MVLPSQQAAAEILVKDLLLWPVTPNEPGSGKGGIFSGPGWNGLSKLRCCEILENLLFFLNTEGNSDWEQRGELGASAQMVSYVG